jgi:hypothetical protein
LVVEMAILPNGPVPEFESENVCAELATPTGTPPKSKGLGVTVATPFPGPVPVVIVVVSVAFAVAEPPPDTLTALVTEPGALLATFTVTVIAG